MKAQQKRARKPATRAQVRPNDMLVHGKVASSVGPVPAGLTVIAFDRDLRTEQKLGQARVGKDGKFRIAYSRKTFARAEKAGADLIVRVMGADGKQLAESPIQFNAGANTEIDLTVAAARASVWETLTAAVAPLLEGQSVLPDAFTQADYEFIVPETGLDRDLVIAWATSYRAAIAHPLLAAGARHSSLSLKSMSSASHTHGTNAAALIDWLFYFACERESGDLNVDTLLQRSTAELLAFAMRAVAANFVPARLLDFIKPLQAALDRLRADVQLQPADEGQPARLGELLDSVEPQWLGTDMRRRVAALLERVSPDAPQFIDEAVKIGLGQRDAVVLGRTLKLGSLTENHLPLVAALQPLVSKDADTSLAGLAHVNVSQWIDLTYERGVAPRFRNSPDTYALHLRDSVERAAPEATLQARLAQGRLALSGQGFGAVQRFLANNRTFRFSGGDLQSFVAKADLSGIEASPEAIVSALGQLRTLQRAGVRWDETPAFLDAGLGAPEALAEYDSAGLQRLLGNRIPAARLEEVAQYVAAMKIAGIGLMNQILPLMKKESAAVMQARMLTGGSADTVAAEPSLRQLFGTLERCVCDPCQSVLSPSAYFADLLKFVGRDNGMTWHLHQRRADFYDLELSCDNAQIELPHIDLVNEVLENAIALPFEITLPGVVDVVAALQQRPLPAALVAALQETTWEPLVEANLAVDVRSVERMNTIHAVITDRYRRWTLELSNGYFGPFGGNTGIEVHTIDSGYLQTHLNKGEVPPNAAQAIKSYLARHAAVSGDLPLAAADIKIEPVEENRHWDISYQASGKAAIDDAGGKIRYTAEKTKKELNYSVAALGATRRKLDRRDMGGVLLAEVADAGNYVVDKLEEHEWQYSKNMHLRVTLIPAGVAIKSLAYQCTARDRDLLARPQHRNPRAYRNFLARADAVYPWTLPFDIDLAETRALLGAAGTSRAALMIAALPPANIARTAQAATERLGMTRAELTLATTTAAAAVIYARWGLQVSGATATVFDTFGATHKTAPPLELLATVSILLQQSRLSFAELDLLLQSEFVNPGRQTRIAQLDDAEPGEECDPTKLQLVPVTPELLDRLHRFVRWQRRLKWPVVELDIALRALAAQQASADSTAIALADIEALRARLAMPLDMLLTALFGFDRTRYQLKTGDSISQLEPLYERIFQDPRTPVAVTGAGIARSVDAELAYAALTNAASSATISSKLSAIAACVGLRSNEVLPLLNMERQLAGQNTALSGSEQLTIEHLRALLRDARLAKALGVSATRLLSLFDLTGSQPFASPRALLDFCDRLDFLSIGSIDVDQLRYVLTHRGAQSYAWVLTREQAQRTLSGLQTTLRNTREQWSAPLDVGFLAEAQLEALLANNTSPAQRKAILAGLTQLDAHQIERVALSQWASFDAAFANAASVRNLITRGVQWRRRAVLIAGAIAQASGLAAALVENLLWFHLRSAANVPAMELFADPAPRSPQTPFEDAQRVFDSATVEQTAAYAVLLKLHKIGLLNETWRLTATDLARFPNSANTNTLRGLSLDALPVTSANGLFSDWQRSAALLRLCRGARGMATVVDDYARAISPPAADPIAAGAATLAAGLGLVASEVEAFARAGFLEFNAATAPLQELRDPLRLVRWIDLLRLAQRYGLTSSAFAAIIDATPGRAAIDAALVALRARHGEPDWRAVLAKATDLLRVEQRDRLVDYLVWRDRLRDADALYERYLIDVQMAPCAKTTRLLQATAGVQLFVQRCLLNLERAIAPATVDPDNQWQWRKNYRVWEANRKIFLFPENWLHPELRDDKSEIYRSFESALMQSEPNEANTRNAVQGYLESLIEVSHISTMGMYEEDVSGRRVLHVVGRSPDPPFTYFYRTNVQNGAAGNRWTPWERIALDLPACHVVPFVLGGELHLVWPLIQLERDNSGRDFYEIRLAWSRRTSLGWAQRKVAVEATTRIAKNVRRDEKNSLALKLVEPASSPRRAGVEVYVARNPVDEVTRASIDPVNSFTPELEFRSGRWGSFNLNVSVSAYLQYSDSRRIVRVPGCQFNLVGLKPDPANTNYLIGGVVGGPDAGRERTRAFPADGSQIGLAVGTDMMKVYLEARASFGGAQLFATTGMWEEDDTDYIVNANANVNILFTLADDPDFDDPNPDENPYSRLKMDLAGRFWFDIGRDTAWEETKDSPISLPVPYEAISWESRFLERRSLRANRDSGLRSVANQLVFEQSRGGADFVALPAPRPSSQSGQTWYWEENSASGVARFFAQPASGQQETLVRVQPAAFEESGDYRAAFTSGLADLYSPAMQEAPLNKRFGVDALPAYFPSGAPGIDPRTLPLLQFNLSMPYASYNWEVFYHVPMAVARFLMTQQRYADVQRWLACVLDPMTNDPASGRERYWRCLPLRQANTPQSIEQLMTALANPNSDPAVRQAILEQVAAAEAEPFSPFAVARVRNSAYEWYACTTYVRNLIEWGDSLFRRDTREAINEAALLYVLAGKILGRRPEPIPRQGFVPPPLTYRALAGKWDDFSNAWVKLVDTPLGQLILQWMAALASIGGINPNAWTAQLDRLMSTGALYFCIPQNDQVLELWDLVADRLWKIRHCRNMDGIERPLALLDPPIDPELLIRARLAGVDIADVLADQYAPTPAYRFGFLIQKAQQLCAELKSAGTALLAAIEKKDAEKLALLRSTQEIEMLGLIEAVKLDQVAEADANILVLQQSREGVIDRYRYLQRMLGTSDITFDAEGVPVMEQHGTLQVRDAAAPGDFRGLALVQSEVDQVQRMQDAHIASVVGGALKLAASGARVAASVLKGYPLTTTAADAVYYTGQALSDLGDLSGLIASNADQWSRRSGLIASFQRRREEWIQQSSAAINEVKQINRQIAAARIRKELMVKDLANHRRSIQNARQIDDYIRQRKFSNAELYVWMEGQLKAAHYATYQLAYDLAKRAERAWRRDLGENQSSWIRYGYWDAARFGLQSGEQLQVDLQRMEMAYLERGKREYELTKHVSMRLLDPAALIELKQEGTCTVAIPEVLFDLDFPGHYFRRIKALSISIPCVTGPYGGVPCTLKLLSSSVRTQTGVGGGYNRTDDDTRFHDVDSSTEAVAISSAQDDSGLFETNLRDERYLPFEGMGAVSTWQLRLPASIRPFDYDTISDVVFHIRYTAREGGDELRSSAQADIQRGLNEFARGEQDEDSGLLRMLSLRQDFPMEWHRLTHPNAIGTATAVDLTITKDRFPFLFASHGVSLTLRRVEVYAVPKAAAENFEFPDYLELTPPQEQDAVEWEDDVAIGPLPGKSVVSTLAIPTQETGAKWQLALSAGDIEDFSSSVADLLIALPYSVRL